MTEKFGLEEVIEDNAFLQRSVVLLSYRVSITSGKPNVKGCQAFISDVIACLA